MKVLSFTAARHFASNYSGDQQSRTKHLEDLFASLPVKLVSIDEGTSEFEAIRDGILRHSERSALMATACYLRALENLRPGSAFWASTGLYYSCFFAARAVLGLFGCWFGSAKSWVDVSDSTPGSLKLGYHKTHYNKSLNGGSHQIFWHAYYAAAPGIANWVGPSAAAALVPVNAQESWLIDNRNYVNYRSLDAFALADNYIASYDATKIPGCLPAPILPMLTVSRAFFSLLQELLTQVNLATDVIGVKTSRASWIADLLTNPQDLSLQNFSTNSGIALPV
jgi:hypothetical protein